MTMLLAVTVLTALAPQRPTLPEAYSIRTLVPLDGFELAAPTAIGEDATIVGSLDEALGFAWSSGVMRALRAPVPGAPSRVLGLGPTGFALGSSLEGFEAVATAWDLDDALDAPPLVLGALGHGPMSIAVAANTRRLAVGWDDDGISPRPVAYRQTPGGFVTHPLPLPPGHVSGLALDVDELGRVVGVTAPFGADEAALWWEDRGAWRWSPLPSLAPQAAAVAVAFAGPSAIAGHGVRPGFGNRLLAWVAGQAIDLGAPDGFQAFARDAASSGVVVGYAIAPDLSRHAVAHPGSDAPTHGVVLLHDRLPLGTRWTALREATGVNARGEIVGYGDVDGRSAGFALTPVRRTLVAPSPLHAGGADDLVVLGAAPGARIDLYASLAPGETVLPAMLQSLDLDGARWLGWTRADGAGRARFELNLGAGAAAYVLYLQALDSTAEEVSQVIQRAVE